MFCSTVCKVGTFILVGAEIFSGGIFGSHVVVVNVSMFSNIKRCHGCLLGSKHIMLTGQYLAYWPVKEIEGISESARASLVFCQSCLNLVF